MLRCWRDVTKTLLKLHMSTQWIHVYHHIKKKHSFYASGIISFCCIYDTID